jgi:hypothetical protein
MPYAVIIRAAGSGNTVKEFFMATVFSSANEPEADGTGRETGKTYWEDWGGTYDATAAKERQEALEREAEGNNGQYFSFSDECADGGQRQLPAAEHADLRADGGAFERHALEHGQFVRAAGAAWEHI